VKLNGSLGMLFLGVWLLLMGLPVFLHLTIPSRDLVMPALAVAAGVLLILGR